jgi:hypothetical protein
MAARFYFNHPDDGPTEITDRIDRRIPWALQERAEEGMPGSNYVVLADPEMDLDIAGHRRAWVIEDTSEITDNVLWYGWIGQQKVSRGQGDDLQITARRWSVEFIDFNGVWNRRVIQSETADRDPETDVERMDWMLGLATSGIFDDVTTYFHTGSPVNMDEGNYVGQYRDQVIDDCAQASGKNWWAKGYETGSGRETFVWYGHDGEEDYVSPLRMSNDPADWDDALLADGTSLCWPISEDTELSRDPSRQYSGVYLEYEGGAVYRKKDATIDDIGRRDFIAPSRMVKTKTKAEARANRYLNKLDTQDETIQTRIRVPAAKGTSLRAGMRTLFKATHLPGYDDEFYWVRVLSCTVQPVSGGEFYDLSLELSTDGVGAGNEIPPAEDATAGMVLYEPDNVDAAATSHVIEFHATGDAPNPGYPTVAGDLTNFDYVVGDDFEYKGFEVLATSGVLDLHLKTSFINVATAPSVDYTMRILLNGSQIAAQTITRTGVGARGDTGTFDLYHYDQAVVSGDILTVDFTTSVLAGPAVPFAAGDNTQLFEILPTSTVIP